MIRDLGIYDESFCIAREFLHYPIRDSTSRQNYITSRHCIQDVPCTNLLKSSFVDPSAMTAVLAGRHKPIRDQGGTQNNNSEGKLEFSIHPLVHCESFRNPLTGWKISVLSAM